MPALALTRCSIRTEVLSLYIAENRFQILADSPVTVSNAAIRSWMILLGPHARHLKSVKLVLVQREGKELSPELTIAGDGLLDIKLVNDLRDGITNPCLCAISGESGITTLQALDDESLGPMKEALHRICDSRVLRKYRSLGREAGSSGRWDLRECNECRKVKSW